MQQQSLLEQIYKHKKKFTRIKLDTKEWLKKRNIANDSCDGEMDITGNDIYMDGD